jgi:hypothetical protein
MKMAVESMKMAPGAIPHPDRVPEQRLLSLETRLQWRQCCGTFRGWMPIDLGFSRWGVIYRRKGEVGGRPRGPHHAVALLEVGLCHPVVRPPPGSSPVPFGLHVHDRKIGTSGFVLSNFENISFW